MARRIVESRHAGLGESVTPEKPSLIATLAKREADGKARPRARHEAQHDPARIEARHRRIAEIAYLRAERRGFAAGSELEDWLVAERAVDTEDRTLDL